MQQAREEEEGDRRSDPIKTSGLGVMGSYARFIAQAKLIELLFSE